MRRKPLATLGARLPRAAGTLGARLANWWWLTAEGEKVLLDPDRTFNQEKAVAEALAAVQPADKETLMAECRRRGVKSEGSPSSGSGETRDPLYENVSFHLWNWGPSPKAKKRGMASSKRRGGEFDRRRRRESAAGAEAVEQAVLRVAVEPVTRPSLATVVIGLGLPFAAAGAEVDAAIEWLLADGKLVQFKGGKLMAAEDKA
jgi:hypothetical protein